MPLLYKPLSVINRLSTMAKIISEMMVLQMITASENNLQLARYLSTSPFSDYYLQNSFNLKKQLEVLKSTYQQPE